MVLGRNLPFGESCNFEAEMKLFGSWWRLVMVNLGLRETLPRQGGGRYFARLCYSYPKSWGSWHDLF
jgi:hypothetical protein